MGLEDDPFDHRITKSGTVMVSRGGQHVVTVAGAQAQKLIGKLGRSDEEDQQLLARATGNYRRGNERRGGSGAS
ncbi:hypothetical protein ACQBAU_03105 [Propionibacteriaceae bacterium Y2011]|uniref:hypothetical protein n=1 Tax=Microlunatus sp. Y2014 TaxID=3418488 RepID=UPI003B4520A6